MRYWTTRVWSSGGAESTKNREEQTNFSDASWVLDGVIAGLKDLYPDRYDENGNLGLVCKDGLTTKYAGECEQIIADYAASFANTCQTDIECTTPENIACNEGNDPAGVALSGDQCQLIDLDYGYKRYVDKASISCTDPADFSALTGYDSCMF